MGLIVRLPELAVVSDCTKSIGNDSIHHFQKTEEHPLRKSDQSNEINRLTFTENL